MLLLDLIEWSYEHWGELSLSALLLFVLRKFIMSEVHKLLHFGRDEELEWTRRKLEELIGEKWSGPQPFWNRVRIHYTKRYYSSSRKATKLERQLRRITMQNINKAMLLPLFSTLLLIIKSATGYEVPIPNADIPVDFILSVGTIIGYFMHPTGQPITGVINKALIMPIFAFMGLVLSLITHHAVSNDLVNAAADFVVYALAMWGQFMHPVKPVQSPFPNSKNFIQG